MLRRLGVQEEGGAEREISHLQVKLVHLYMQQEYTHLQVKDWGDYSVPDTTDTLLQMIQSVRQIEKKRHK